MFDNLSDRLSATLKQVRGQAKLSEENIRDALRDVRMALLEADVALEVVREFIGRVRERAVGQEVVASVSPGQMFIKVVQDELQAVMGDQAEGLDLNAQPPAVVLMAGLQGAGKTTTAGKLALWLKDRQKKKVGLVSADVYRPAAIDQLQRLAEQVGADFIPTDASNRPEDIARAAHEIARQRMLDVLIVDTAGRLTVDEEMMAEIRQVHAAINPVETLFVLDSMTGQDAAVSAKAFNDALPLTGVVLTKADGDARGGAALSVRQITGKPIKFIGLGEKLENLELFHPDRIASRILGMGDVASLVEEAQRKVDHTKAEKLAKKLEKGKRFTLDDFRDQMLQMQNMGGLTSMMDKLPGMGELPDAVKNKVNDKETVRTIAIINSMTPKERKFPDVIRGSRKRRIAQGSGTAIQDVNKLLKQFTQMQKMMKKVSKGGMAGMMKKLKGRMPPGGMPPGGMPF
jgi:signal recognition particle subunit SRP54